MAHKNTHDDARARNAEESGAALLPDLFALLLEEAPELVLFLLGVESVHVLEAFLPAVLAEAGAVAELVEVGQEVGEGGAEFVLGDEGVE